jgi:hypothetical protein
LAPSSSSRSWFDNAERSSRSETQCLPRTLRFPRHDFQGFIARRKSRAGDSNVCFGSVTGKMRCQSFFSSTLGFITI